MSALEDVRVNRGSTLISLAPLSFALFIQVKDAGWFSAGLHPMARMQSALAISFQWLVIAPRPKLAAKPATVDECQTRAWCSMRVTPRARRDFTSAWPS